MSRYALIVLLLATVLATGCGGDAASAEGESSVRSMEAYKEEAKTEITDENAEAKLDELLKEIDGDTALPE